MRNPTTHTHLTAHPSIDLELDTARWTSPVYSISFAQLSQVTPEQQDNDAFRLSAWGISDGMAHLLASYSQQAIKRAVDWLVIQQNGHVGLMLSDAMMHEDFHFSLLDQIFISIDAELYLPRGLRMHVTCITNIVQIGSDYETLDKFVAVLDPGEAETYVLERRGMTVSNHTGVVQ